MASLIADLRGGWGRYGQLLAQPHVLPAMCWSCHGRVLVVTGAAYGGGVLAMVHLTTGTVALAAVAAVTGLVTPPLTPALRATLPLRVPREERTAAYAMESMLQEVVFVVGPVVAGAVALRWGATAALSLAAATTVLGTVGYVVDGGGTRRRHGCRLPAGRRGPRRHRRACGLRSLLAGPEPARQEVTPWNARATTR